MEASIADCVPRSARALVARAPHRARYGRRPWTSRGVRAAVPVRGDVGWRAEQGGGHAFGEGVGLRPGASPGRPVSVSRTCSATSAHGGACHTCGHRSRRTCRSGASGCTQNPYGPPVTTGPARWKTATPTSCAGTAAVVSNPTTAIGVVRSASRLTTATRPAVDEPTPPAPGAVRSPRHTHRRRAGPPAPTIRAAPHDWSGSGPAGGARPAWRTPGAPRAPDPASPRGGDGGAGAPATAAGTTYSDPPTPRTFPQTKTWTGRQTQSGPRAGPARQQHRSRQLNHRHHRTKHRRPTGSPYAAVHPRASRSATWRARRLSRTRRRPAAPAAASAPAPPLTVRPTTHHPSRRPSGVPGTQYAQHLSRSHVHAGGDPRDRHARRVAGSDPRRDLRGDDGA